MGVRRTASLLALGLLTLGTAAVAGPAPVALYGASNDLGDGNFGTVNEATGVFTDLGDTPTGQQMPALACNTQNLMFGAEAVTAPQGVTAVGGGSRCSVLHQLNPANGASLTNFGVISVSGVDNSCVHVSDFDFSPASGVLYGVGRSTTTNRDGLYTITVASPPVATLVGLLDPPCTESCLERGGLSFRDDGALFLTSIGRELAQLNPATAAVIGAILPITVGVDPLCIDSSTFRNSDDVLFAIECDSDDLHTIDETTGAATLVNGAPGEDLGSLAFCFDRVVLGPTSTPTSTSSLGPSPTPTLTRTPTQTSTVTNTPTITPTGQAIAPAIPALPPSGLGILALVVGASALLLLRTRR